MGHDQVLLKVQTPWALSRRTICWWDSFQSLHRSFPLLLMHTPTLSHKATVNLFFFFFPSLSLTQNPPVSALWDPLGGGEVTAHFLPLFCLWSASCSDCQPLGTVGDQVHKLRFLYQQVLTWENFRRKRIFNRSSTIGCFTNSSLNEERFIWASICWLTPRAHSFQEVGLATDAG